MFSTTLWESRDEAQLFENASRWLDAWLTYRDNGFNTAILEGDSNQLLVVLVQEEGGQIARLSLSIADPSVQHVMLQPSMAGIGETLAAERLLAEECPELGWVMPERPTIRGKGLFVYPLGPVRADIAESLGYRLTVMGDEIVHLDLRAGFKPRHIRALVQGRTIEEALPVIARFTTTSNVHHSLAMALAVEQAWDLTISEAANQARTLLAELERAHSHMGDLALLAVSTGLPLPQMEYLHLKETLLRLNHRLFGHRYLRECVIPGGINHPCAGSNDLKWAQVVARDVLNQSDTIAGGLENTPSFLDRLHGAGIIPSATVASMRPVGPVGRASGRPQDIRTIRPYGSYATYAPAIFKEAKGDSYARFRVRAAELHETLVLISHLLDEWDTPPTIMARWDSRSAPKYASGLGIVEAPRGLLAYALHINPDNGRIIRLGVATPSQRNWMTVPAAMANGNVLQDFPIIDASFALSVAGWDG